MSNCCFIEIAAGTARAGIVEGRGKKASISSYHEEPFHIDDDELPKRMTELFELLASRVRFIGKNVVIGISSRYLIFREVSFPFSDRRRVSRTLPFQIEEKIPLPIDEVIIDAFEISKNDNASTWFACCIKKKLLRGIIDACDNLRMDPNAITPSFTGFPFLLPSDGKRLVVDFGHETTNLLLVKGEKILFMRSLRFAGKTITRSLADALSVDFSVAEETKHTSGGFSDMTSSIRETLSTAMNRLVREIKMTLSSIPEELVPESLYLCGGGAGIAGLDDFLSGKLSLPCEVAEADNRLNTSSLLSKPKTLGFLAPAGLCLAENAGRRQLINFRKDEFAYHGLFDRIAVPLFLMLLFIAATIAVGGFFFYKKHSKAKSMEAAAFSTMESWWNSVFKDAPAPNHPDKYKPFVDEMLLKLSEEGELLQRYYAKSALEGLKRVSMLFANVRIKLIRLESSKKAIKLVCKVQTEDINAINDALQRARRYFEPPRHELEQLSDEEHRLTVNFLYKEEVK